MGKERELSEKVEIMKIPENAPNNLWKKGFESSSDCPVATCNYTIPTQKKKERLMWATEMRVTLFRKERLFNSNRGLH